MNAELVERIYREHHGWLQRWLAARLNYSDVAADLAQDAFVRLLGSRDARDLRKPRAYLHTMAHGLLVDHFRRRDLERAWEEAMSALPEAEAPSAEECAAILQTLDRVDAALSRLPAAARKAFLLSQLHGLTYADIAAQLGVSLITVKRHMFKAFQACLAVA